MVFNQLVTLLVFGLFQSGSGQSGGGEMFCYECTSAMGCESHTDGILHNCYDELGDSTAGVTVSCYSAFLNYTGVTDWYGNPRDNETGVYRGCAVVPSTIPDYCEWYRAEMALNNIRMPSCRSCNESRCNRHVFNMEDGSFIGLPNGAHLVTVSVILYMIGVGMTKLLK